jgi:hypothetical protein
VSNFIETNQYIRDFGGHEMVRQLYDNLDFTRRGYRLQDFENDLANSFVEEWNRDSSFLLFIPIISFDTTPLPHPP